MELIVDNENGEPRQHFSGFNTNMISGVFSYADEELVDAVQPLQPSWLRFPGGTVANFYSWKREGFDNKSVALSASETLNGRNQRNTALLAQRRDGVIAFQDFLQFSGRVGALPELVLNVFSDDIATTRAWATAVKELGVDVLAWELGNELYLPHYRNRISSVGEYVELAREHARTLKAVLPTATVLVPVHAVGFHLYPSSRYANRWNARLAEEDFYDGVVVHLYFHVEKYFEPGDFENDRRQSFTKLITLTQRSVANAQTYYRDLYGEHGVWVSEWNLIDRDFTIVGSPMHALWAGDFLIQLLSWDDQLLLSGYNTLAGRPNGFPVIVPGRKDESGRALTSRTTPAYVPLMLVNSSLGDSSVIHDVVVKGAPSIGDGVSALAAVAYSNETGLYVALSNRTGSEQEVTLSLGSGDSVAEIHMKSFSAGPDLQRARLNRRDVVSRDWCGNTLTLPAYSFAIATVK